MAARSARRRGSREAFYLYGVHPVREALRAGRRPLSQLLVRKDPQPAELPEILAAAREAGVPVEEVGADELTAAVPRDANHQGLVLVAGDLPEVGLDDLPRGEGTTLVALDRVEDPRNVGAIARVAEAAGAAGLILTRRRAPPLGPAVARASAGAIEWLPAARVPNLPRALNTLKSRGFWVFGAAVDAPVDLYEVPSRWLSGDRVLVLGAEGRGLRRGVRLALDHWVRIPMVGHVGSLNVAAAAAVLLFELGRRNRVAGGPGLA